MAQGRQGRARKTPAGSPVRDRIRELIRDRLVFLRATDEELLTLCRDHRAVFAGEYVTSWPEAEEDERLFRRTSEEYKKLRIDPSRFSVICIHELGRYSRDSEAFFRFVWLANQRGWSNGLWTSQETAWLAANLDQVEARGDGRTITGGHSYTDRGLKYAEDVVSGRIPAARWVRLACQRQIDDLRRSGQYPGDSEDD